MDEREQSSLIDMVARVAERWRDPAYEPREQAVERTLLGETTYTEESLAFVVNQAMHELTALNLRTWLENRRIRMPVRVGVLNSGVFFTDVQDFLAVVLTGHAYTGVPHPDSWHVLQSLVDDFRSETETIEASFGARHEVFERSDALIAMSDEEANVSIAEESDRYGIAPQNRLVRPWRSAVAVLDGRETQQEMENLAEDLLLHDGRDPRSVKIVWAPVGLNPDDILGAMAVFRGVFPAHPGIPGSLKMQQAFLDALKAPNAYGEGMAFLLSKGEPEVQSPAHVRWTEYQKTEDVSVWLSQRSEHVELMVGAPALVERIGPDIPRTGFGDAQRPPLSWCPGGFDTIGFLIRL